MYDKISIKSLSAFEVWQFGLVETFENIMEKTEKYLKEIEEMQYYMFVNPDKKEYFTPYNMGELGKLCEFAHPYRYGHLSASAFAMLMADAGQAEFVGESVVGRWRGDKAVVVGQCALPENARPKPVWNETRKSWENGTELDLTTPNLYTLVEENFNREWKNIAIQILTAMADDKDIAEFLRVAVEDYHRWNIPEWGEYCATVISERLYETEEHRLAWVLWHKLFDNDSDFYRTANGITKHHGRRFDLE